MDSLLTRDDLANIMRVLPDLTFANGEWIINKILDLQESKQSVDPIDVYAKMQDSDAAHKWLTDFALKSEVCQQFVLKGLRIQAIKEIRTLTHAGLKPAKEAFEAAYPHWNVRNTYGDSSW